MRDSKASDKVARFEDGDEMEIAPGESEAAAGAKTGRRCHFRNEKDLVTNGGELRSHNDRISALTMKAVKVRLRRMKRLWRKRNRCM